MANKAGKVEVSITIEAPAKKVFDLVSDPTNYARWSPEATGVRRLRGEGQWRVNDTFTGRNKQRLSWQTSCRVTQASLDDGFFFEVTSGPFPVATWGYRVSATDDGCQVTEIWQDNRQGISAFLIKPVAYVLGRGWDTAGHNRATMTATLAALKREAEADS